MGPSLARRLRKRLRLVVRPTMHERRATNHDWRQTMFGIRGRGSKRKAAGGFALRQALYCVAVGFGVTFLAASRPQTSPNPPPVTQQPPPVVQPATATKPA